MSSRGDGMQAELEPTPIPLRIARADAERVIDLTDHVLSDRALNSQKIEDRLALGVGAFSTQLRGECLALRLAFVDGELSHGRVSDPRGPGGSRVV